MTNKIFFRFFGLSLLLAGLFLSISVHAQPSSLTKDEMLQYTPLWQGERFPDGRPKVSDDIIERMKYVSITEAWGALRRSNDDATSDRGGNTYVNQYTYGYKRMNDLTICGRASTIHFMPYRPDVNKAIQEVGDKEGRSSQYTWGVDVLQDGDVYVANVCEGILDASHVGDNLGTTIFTKTGNGAIIRGTVRDLEGNQSLEGFNLMVRDFRPQSNASNMVIGINAPIQVGYITVMPGDIVLPVVIRVYPGATKFP